MLKLRGERKARGWTLTEVARWTGIHISNLSKIERGGLPVFPGWGRRLVRVFQMSGEILFQEAPTESGPTDGTEAGA